jgi:hypothetical protein
MEAEVEPMNGIKIAIAAIALILLVQTVNATEFSMLTPKMIIRMNTSDTKIQQIGVKNPNNVSANVTLTPTGEIEDITKLSETFFVLSAGEEKWINFTLTPKNPGNYSGEVLATFIANNQTGITLSSQIIVFATGEPIPEKPVNPLVSFWNNFIAWLRGVFK